MKLQLKQDKGTAGLTILLSLIVMLFIIGLIVMIFTVMGSKLADSTYDSTSRTATSVATSSPVNETGTYVSTYSSLRGCVLTATQVMKANASSVIISSGNYTISGCQIKCNGCRGDFNNTVWNVTGSYIYNQDNAGTDAINNTIGGIAGVTTWFPLFIVIGAMVVLILLTVIIITAIRQSGMVGISGDRSGEGTA